MYLIIIFIFSLRATVCFDLSLLLLVNEITEINLLLPFLAITLFLYTIDVALVHFIYFFFLTEKKLFSQNR